jgi:hypothetical protein
LGDVSGNGSCADDVETASSDCTDPIRQSRGRRSESVIGEDQMCDVGSSGPCADPRGDVSVEKYAQGTAAAALQQPSDHATDGSVPGGDDSLRYT